MAANLKEEFIKVHRAYNLPPGDFPDINRFRDRLVNTDLDKFPKLRKELVSSMDEVPHADHPAPRRPGPDPEEMNPFAEDAVDEWTIPPAEKAIYEQRFMQVAVAGKVSGAAAKPVLLETGLPNDVLRPLWAMSDIDRDGSLDMGEFCVALHLAKMARAQGVLPASLPPQLAAVAHREGTVPTPPLGAPPAFAMPSVPVLPPPMPPMMPPRS
ncbi:putative Spectrin beta chain; brain 4 [Paratrimastix pyriformis]|uniref:Spectrin beta chain n=1 Tax=Paratrimastix pyriformis TaxID=342808 RepID=A0ABQ8UGY5_9EUKA|nr:putative Spectrin beta chain; brain 4 [Paratrimastix pyriformis]